jgi:hypothetical protein
VSTETPHLRKRSTGCLKTCLISSGTILILAGLFIYPVFKNAKEKAIESSGIQSLSAIQIALVTYSFEHDGKFPQGKSSTEVFQKLLDGGYISDATTFYYPLPRRTGVQPDSKKLMPENVSFDVTDVAYDQIPDDFPVVFLSGFKVDYQAGAKAVPLEESRSWADWLKGRHHAWSMLECTKDGKASFVPTAPDGTIPDFIPADFDSKGKTYSQLTPDGELGP